MSKANYLFALVLALNVLAIIIGYFFYQEQLSSTSPVYWFFIPDCPLYVFFSLLILLGIVKNDLLRLIISACTIKYGIWTMSVLLFSFNYYLLSFMLPVSLVLLIGHAGMTLEGLLLIPRKKATLAALAFLFCWFIANDFVDYVLGAHPPVPQGTETLTAFFTLGLSIAIVLLWGTLHSLSLTKAAEKAKSFLGFPRD